MATESATSQAVLCLPERRVASQCWQKSTRDEHTPGAGGRTRLHRIRIPAQPPESALTERRESRPRETHCGGSPEPEPEPEPEPAPRSPGGRRGSGTRGDRAATYGGRAEPGALDPTGEPWTGIPVPPVLAATPIPAAPRSRFLGLSRDSASPRSGAGPALGTVTGIAPGMPARPPRQTFRTYLPVASVRAGANAAHGRGPLRSAGSAPPPRAAAAGGRGHRRAAAAAARGWAGAAGAEPSGARRSRCRREGAQRRLLLQPSRDRPSDPGLAPAPAAHRAAPRRPRPRGRCPAPVSPGDRQSGRGGGTGRENLPENLFTHTTPYPCQKKNGGDGTASSEGCGMVRGWTDSQPD